MLRDHLPVQSKSQMEKRYGKDAEAMLSQPATKIFLKTSEPRAAKWVSEAIGEIEVERLKESRSMALLNSRQSFAMEIATKPLVMPSEIAGLAPLHGYIKQENRVVAAHFELAKKRAVQAEFVARQYETLATHNVAEPSAPPVKATPSAPLAEEHAESQVEQTKAKQEAFRWDSSREIE